MKETWEIVDRESIIGRYEEAVNYYNVICEREIDECIARRDLAVMEARKKIEESAWRKVK